MPISGAHLRGRLGLQHEAPGWMAFFFFFISMTFFGKVSDLILSQDRVISVATDASDK